MPLILKEGLIAKENLLKENIFAIDKKRAQGQDIRPLKIAIVNLMPNKEETEINLLKLLSSQVLQIEVDLIRTASYKSKHADLDRLEEYYKTFEEIKDDKYDGLIVTGAPLEDKDYADISYWEELKEIFDFARTKVYSSLFICWGAVAALDYFYGVQATLEGEKIFGVYDYEKKSESNLLAGLDDTFSIPQSRYKKLDEESISTNELKILAGNSETGVSLLESLDGRFVFNLGHLEYPKETLHNEYHRDLAKGLSISKPKNYYKTEEANADNIRLTWQATASIFFSNWLNYYVYQKTPYSLADLRPKKVAKFGGSSLASSQQFEKVKNIIAEDDKDIIVVSAPGKRYAEDIKVTDKLIGLYEDKERLGDLEIKLGEIKKQIADLDHGIKDKLADLKTRYLDILSDLGQEDLKGEVAGLIDSLYQEDSKDYIVSRGEYLNGKILAAYLGYDFVDAKDLIFLSDSKIDQEKTAQAIREKIQPGKKYVIPGFYGSQDGRVHLLKRGGSDYTGSILAASLACKSYENWTDVSGIMDKDPAKNSDAKAYKTLTYQDLKKILESGAQVYQEDALEPLIGKNIELKILNTNRPDDAGTVIRD